MIKKFCDICGKPAHEQALKVEDAFRFDGSVSVTISLVFDVDGYTQDLCLDHKMQAIKEYVNNLKLNETNTIP